MGALHRTVLFLSLLFIIGCTTSDSSSDSNSGSTGDTTLELLKTPVREWSEKQFEKVEDIYLNKKVLPSMKESECEANSVLTEFAKVQVVNLAGSACGQSAKIETGPPLFDSRNDKNSCQVFLSEKDVLPAGSNKVSTASHLVIYKYSSESEAKKAFYNFFAKEKYSFKENTLRIYNNNPPPFTEPEYLPGVGENAFIKHDLKPLDQIFAQKRNYLVTIEFGSIVTTRINYGKAEELKDACLTKTEKQKQFLNEVLNTLKLSIN